MEDLLPKICKGFFAVLLRNNPATADQVIVQNPHLTEEKCPYCAAPIHFDSPDEAFCQSQHQNKKRSKDKERCDQRRKLKRCCVSMRVCAPTPLWFCKCCNRMTLELDPETLLALPSFPSDLKSLPGSSFSKVASKLFCLLCGILLQRKQPEFLLSASPV